MSRCCSGVVELEAERREEGRRDHGVKRRVGHRPGPKETGEAGGRAAEDEAKNAAAVAASEEDAAAAGIKVPGGEERAGAEGLAAPAEDMGDRIRLIPCTMTRV
jgi:hypothetical protein